MAAHTRRERFVQHRREDFEFARNQVESFNSNHAFNIGTVPNNLSFIFWLFLTT